MITIRRADERRLDRVGQSEVWSVFTPRDPPGPAYPQDALGLTPDKVEPSAAAVDPRVGSTAEAARRLGAGFGTLTRLIEARLAPGSSFPASRRVKHDVILVSYVREGSIAYQDTEGRSGVVLAGEFHVLTVRSGGRYRHRNASQRAWVTAFQVALRPSSDAELADSSEVQRFSAAERRGGLCVVASADGRRASMRMPGDAMVFSALIARGQHVAYEIVAGRGVWLQLVHGSVRLDDINLTAGDGAGLTGEPSVSFTAREQTEVLLIDVVHLHPPTNPTHVVIGGAVAASPANDGDPSNPAPPFA